MVEGRVRGLEAPWVCEALVGTWHRAFEVVRGLRENRDVC